MVLWFILFDHAVHFSLKKVHCEGLLSTLHLKQNAFKNMQKMQCTLVYKKVHYEGLFSTHLLKQKMHSKNYANAVHFGLEKSPLQRTFHTIHLKQNAFSKYEVRLIV